MQESDIAQIVARLRKLEQRGREVKCEIDGIRSMLRDELNARGVDTFKAGRWTLRRVVYEREQFDTAKFKEQQPTAFKAYCKPVTVSRIDVVG